MFDFRYLMEDMAAKTGYKLYLDYGGVGDDDHPFRVVNEIITPVVGVFRLSPVPLTALTTPYIAVITASVEIPAPTELAEDIRDNLNDVAARFNATTQKVEQGGTNYTIVYSFETCVVGEKRRDVSIYGGEIVPIMQTVTYTIVERGITALDVDLFIDGLPVPFLRMDENRTATSETAPNARGLGEIATTMEMYGLTIETPLVENDLGDLLCEALSVGNGNRAHAVELVRNGRSYAYLMGIGTAASSMVPPNNVGVTLSLAEISPVAAKYNALFKKIVRNGNVVALSYTNTIVYWGDGTAQKLNGYTPHVYDDGRDRHEIWLFHYGDCARLGDIVVGATLFKTEIYPKGILSPSELPTTVLTMTSGDMLRVSGDRLQMVVDGTVYPVDESYPIGGTVVRHPFMSLLRGTVEEINTDLFEYDRWNAIQED